MLRELVACTTHIKTLKMVPALHWIVIEDADAKTELVTKLLGLNFLSFLNLSENCKVPNSHLVNRTPENLRRSICTFVDPKRGCPQQQLGKV